MSNYIHNYSTKEELTNRGIEIEGLIKQENREAEEWETEELDEINEFLELANLSEGDNYYTENAAGESVLDEVYMGLKGGSDSWLIQYLNESGAVEALLNDRFAQIEFRGETFYIKE